MALHDEQADILGGPILQRPESGLLTAFSPYVFVFKFATLLGLGLLAWIACVRGLGHLKKHRELSYRKAMRRKHGIPDSDCRPFAVAYAAAKRAHLEREAQDRKKLTNYVSDHNLPAVDQRTDAQKDARGMRRRVPETTVQLHDYKLPERHVAVFDNKRPEIPSIDIVDCYDLNSRRRVAIPEPSFVEKFPVRRSSKNSLITKPDDNEESRKRSLEDEGDVGHETIKKSRVDSDGLIDGDGRVDWCGQYSDIPPRQAPEKSLDEQPGSEYSCITGGQGPKPVGSLQDEDHESVDISMESVGEDEATELQAVVRGKKRGRAEAGSNFGGDDDDEIRSGRSLHHRKRRTISRKGVEIPARGQKRNRNAESPESESEGGDPETPRRLVHYSSKKKRGKKAASDEASEIRVEDPRISNDALCGGRRIGDEWEADGIQYKVGHKGERLRLTLVKKARNKYHMPQDSQHPDRSAALEIYVETWMTEEQYKQAEGRQELAWQEARRESMGSETPDVLDSPTKNGKSLLWDSVKCSPARRPFRQPMPAGASRINPFDQWQLQPTLGRRVASSSTIVSPVLSGVANSPTRPGLRGFSKWEKQDREAEAMARIRAKVEEQKKARAGPRKSSEVPTSVTSPELAPKSFAPTITITPAPAAAAETQSDSTQQNKSADSTFSFANPRGASSSTKDTASSASTATPGFSLPPTSNPTATPSLLFPNASTTPSTPAMGFPSFSFAKPSHVSSSTSAAPPAIPNFFGKGTAMSASPAPSTSVTNTQSRHPSTEVSCAPTASPFTKPDSSVSSVVTPSATKPQAPIFGAPSGSSPSSVAFNPASANTKAEAPTPPALTSTTSESLKHTPPFFSFSTPSSIPTSTLAASSAPPITKFSLAQPPQMLVPGPQSTSVTASQSPAFKFGQTPGAGVTDGISTTTTPAADEPKKSAVPVPVLGAATDSNGPSKPSPFVTAFAFGSSTFASPSTSATNLSGKPNTVDGDTSTSKPPTVVNTTFAPLPAGPVPDNAPIFSFGVANSGSKSTVELKPASLFKSVSGDNSLGGKPTFPFGASSDGSKSTSIFGSSPEGSKSLFSLAGGSTETSKPSSAFGGVTENRSMSVPATEGSKPHNATDTSKPALNAGSTTFGPFTSIPLFGRRDEPTTNTTNSMNSQPKPSTSFNFGAPSSVTSSVFGQSSPVVTNGDSSQTIFMKPTNTTPGSFGTASSSSGTFTFGKPTTQNQKQEQ